MEKFKRVIKSIKLSSDNIVVIFKMFWYQEDIELLSNTLLSNVSKIQILETIQGADRENIRVIWQTKYYFSLNFDCYSQSCWLEGEDDLSKDQLMHLMSALPSLD